MTYLRTKKDLTRREARWIDFLAEFEFTIAHCPGRENLADSLSRRPDLEAFLKEGQFILDSEEDRELRSDYQADRKAQAIIDRLSKSQRDNFHERYHWDERDHRLFMKIDDSWRLYVPKGAWRLRLMKEYHDSSWPMARFFIRQICNALELDIGVADRLLVRLYGGFGKTRRSFLRQVLLHATFAPSLARIE